MKRALLGLVALVGLTSLPAVASADPWRNDRAIYLDGRDWDRRPDVVIFERGRSLPPAYYSRRYWVEDYRGYHVAPPRRGFEWVHVGPRKLALVNLRTGRIVDVAYIRGW